MKKSHRLQKRLIPFQLVTTVRKMFWHVPVSWPIVCFLGVAYFVAGFIDAIVGGGGLITIPALLLGFPSASHEGALFAQLIGTNKFSACAGTTAAAFRFWRTGRHPLRPVLLFVLCSMGSAVGGYFLFQWVGRTTPGFLQPLLLGIMVSLLLFTMFKPNLGQVHAPRWGKKHQFVLTVLISLGMGFYDGFFGPGVGSLLIFLFVAGLGFDFLHASGTAKFINWGSSFCSMLLFASHKQWFPLLALLLALANIAGGTLGVRFALHKGTRWVRWLFMGVVSILILSVGWKWITRPSFGK